MNNLFTMEEIDKTFTSYKVNELNDGVVVSIKEDGIIFNLGGKLDAFIPKAECANFEDIKIGDRFKVVIINKHDENGNVVASQKLANELEIGNRNAKNIKIGTDFTCVISDVMGNGNLMSKLGQYQIIIPADEISSTRHINPRTFINKQVSVVATEIDLEDKRIIASIKILEDKIRVANETAFWRSIFINKIVDGTVVKIVPYGAFVDVGGVTCLLHISDVSYEKINSVADVLEIGKTYKFKVIKIDKENKKVNLGYKQLQESLKSKLIKQISVGDRLTAKVIKLLPFGAILKAENGLEGLLHIKNATEDRRLQIYQVVKLEQMVDVYVKSVDVSNEKVEFAII